MTSSNPARSTAGGEGGGGWQCPPEVETWESISYTFSDGLGIEIEAGRDEGDLVNFKAHVSIWSEVAPQPLARYWCEGNNVWLVMISGDGMASPRKEFAFVHSSQDVLDVCRGILDIPREQYDQE